MIFRTRSQDILATLDGVRDGSFVSFGTLERSAGMGFAGPNAGDSGKGKGCDSCEKDSFHCWYPWCVFLVCQLPFLAAVHSLSRSTIVGSRRTWIIP